MSYVALYRKFRPAYFSEVKGQDAIVTTLKNQIRSGRIGHAYLFCGTRGTGKTTVAKILAKAVNCEHPVDGEPCGECAVCKGIAAGTLLNVIEIDAASNSGVENVRQIVDEVSYAPTEGKYKVYILDEVHMLSTGAFNALLKTLEEPPEYVIFILATTEAHKIPITIHSRCQRYDFKRISLETITDRLRELTEKEGTDVEEEALRFVAKEADGSMRDALSLLDQCLAFHYGEKLTYDKALDVLGAVDDGIFAQMLSAITERNVTQALSKVEEIAVQGRDLTQFVADFLWFLRNLMLVKTSDIPAERLEISRESLDRLKAFSEKVDLNIIMRYIRVLSSLSADMKYSDQKRVLLEVAIIRMCKPQMETDTDSILDRLRDLENRSGEVQFIPLTAATPGEAVLSSTPVRKQRPVREKALPEDIQKVLSSWNAIKETIDGPLRAQLNQCKLSINDDDVLLIVPLNSLTGKILSKDGTMDKVREIICESVEKDIPVELSLLKQGEDFGSSYVDIEKLFGDIVVRDDSIVM